MKTPEDAEEPTDKVETEGPSDSEKTPDTETPVSVEESAEKEETTGTEESDTVIQTEEMSGIQTRRYSARRLLNGGTGDTRTIYFDATLSVMEYPEEDNIYNVSFSVWGLPEDKLFCYIKDEENKWLNEQNDDEKYQGIGMILSKEEKGYDFVYSVEIPKEAKWICFSNQNDNWNKDRGESTGWLKIPDENEYEKPCFYADTGDDAVFKRGETRGGYWGQAFEVHDAAKGKETEPPVDIPKGTESRDSTKRYIKTTLYDYYTDYELNGNNRDNYDADGRGFSLIQPFRQFNQALSAYYDENDAEHPIYFGEFNNYGAEDFRELNDYVQLYAYENDFGNDSRFFVDNIWYASYPGGSGYKESQIAVQGLIADTLDNKGNLKLSDDVVAPWINKDFLAGTNTKHTKLGEVYENVGFPFDIGFERNPNGGDGLVEYWEFNSLGTNLMLKQDNQDGSYYLEDADGHISGANDARRGNFFPFNTTKQSGRLEKLNYGFTAKLEIPFSLTEYGTVLDSNGNSAPVEFKFSGDDDVWVFIDGELALDIGGAHGPVQGTLNFQNMTATVSRVKNADGGYTDNKESKFKLTEKAGTHVLTMYYMERGLYDSNMSISFNFPTENDLTVEKQVDTTAVNSLFAELFEKMPFTFHIENLVTHYGTVQANGGNSFASDTAISDYDSAKSGKLENASGAGYAHPVSTTGTVDKEGNFQLKSGEWAAFKNQFRRGSYIALKEEDPGQNKNSDLFETSWTMYENGDKVTSLDAVKGLEVEDGRTEKKDVDDHDCNYDGTKPSASTFVVRSYTAPDEISVPVNLKVVYTNRVKTGKLTIGKETASDWDDISGEDTFQFQITYTNVGGIDLAGEPVVETISVKVGDTQTIDGIPVGTEYTVKELDAADGSELSNVKVNGTACEEKEASGTIREGTESVVFINTKKPVMDLQITKSWDAKTDGNLPEEVQVCVQRRAAGSGKVYEIVKGYEKVSLKSADGWKQTVKDLDVYVDYLKSDEKWEYRVLELNENGSPVEHGEKLALAKGNGAGTYKVTYTVSAEDGYHIVNTYIGPYDPDKPSKPDKPNEPDKSNGSHGRSGGSDQSDSSPASSSVVTSGSPATGDSNMIWFWGIAAILSAGAAAFAILRTSRKKK